MKLAGCSMCGVSFLNLFLYLVGKGLINRYGRVNVGASVTKSARKLVMNILIEYAGDSFCLCNLSISLISLFQ